MERWAAVVAGCEQMLKCEPAALSFEFHTAPSRRASSHVIQTHRDLHRLVFTEQLQSPIMAQALWDMEAAEAPEEDTIQSLHMHVRQSGSCF